MEGGVGVRGRDVGEKEADGGATTGPGEGGEVRGPGKLWGILREVGWSKEEYEHKRLGTR
ncbi:hypothetical protein CSW42_09280 [Thermus scotoductus]|nr:hypothetical protein CSW42_09280 [Thermus scotoductus]